MLLFWLIWTVCALLVALAALLAVCRLGAFVLCRRAKLAPPHAPAARAALWLVAVFALPDPLLWFGALLALLLWEAVAWVRQPRPVRVTH